MKKRKPSLGKLMKRIPAIHAETAALCQSKIACAVADEWVFEKASVAHSVELGGSTFEDAIGIDPALFAALDQLEKVTRTSELRKVKP